MRGRPVVPAYRTYERVEQEVEPDEDVRAVQTCQAIEGRSEVEILEGPNLNPRVLPCLDQEKSETKPEGEREPLDQGSARLFILIDWSAQCIVKLEVTRMIVFRRAR